MRGCARERRGSRIARLSTAGLAVALALVTNVSPTWADFGDVVSQSQPVSTATLDAPTNPGVAQGTCVLELADSLVVSWTSTASSWAGGYEVLRSTASGGPYTVVGTVAGVATEAYVDSGLLFSTNYYYLVRATKALWHSAVTAEVSRSTRSPLCL